MTGLPGQDVRAAILVQGLGSVVLVLVCLTLYILRRRISFLYGTLSWGCASVWLLGGAAGREGAHLSWVIRDVGIVCAGGHALLWLLGIRHLVGGLTRAQEATSQARSVSPTSPGSFLAGPLPWRAGATLAGIAGVVALLMGTGRHGVLLSAVLGLTYALSAAACLLGEQRQEGAVGLRLVGTILLVMALAQMGALALLSGRDFGGLSLVTALGDFLLEALLAVGLIVVFLDEERLAMRGVLTRLAESEEHLRLIFQHSGVGMAVLTPEGRFMHLNRALATFLGYEAAELQGCRLVDLAHPEDRSQVISRTEQGAELPADLYERERRYKHKDGRTIWARVLRVPVRDGAGKVRYIVAVLLDITERHRVEEALAISEERYRLRFEGAFDGLMVCAETGEFLDANPAFCRMLGYALPELQHSSVADVAADLPLLRRHFRAALEQGGDRFETILRRKDGSKVDVEIASAIISPQRDQEPAGGPKHPSGQRLLHSVTRDITERKRAEEALRRAEQGLREERDFSNQVLDTADALIMVLDPAARIVRFNAKCALVCGYGEAEVRGRVCWEFLLPARCVENARTMFERLLNGDGQALPVVLENTWRRRDGQERQIAWRNATVRAADGKLRYVIATGIDVTEQRLLEEQLQHAQKMETLGTLVGGIAHDFNNQLAVILGNLELALADLHHGTNGRHELLDAEKAAQRCADMTQSLLAFGRRRPGQPRALDLNGLLAEAERLLRRVLPATIAIHTCQEPRAWPVRADATQLHQVVMNLAVNARDAMPVGGTLSLVTRNELVSERARGQNVEARVGRHVVLNVQDTGMGMTAEVKARIFEPFFTTKPVGSGTGLGLAMVYGIVKATGGWIVVHSEEGQGTTFEIYLPALEEEEALAVPAWTPVRGGSECVLVVDDQALVRDLAQHVLERWGFRVLTAEDGRKAVELYGRAVQGGGTIDVVLLDYTMPGMTGLQVLEQLRRLDSNVRVVFSSGRPLDGSYEGPAEPPSLLLERGALAFIAKPYRAEDLVRQVRQALDSPLERMKASSEGGRKKDEE
jgi:PAS domain S-box-containing protein